MNILYGDHTEVKGPPCLDDPASSAEGPGEAVERLQTEARHMGMTQFVRE